MAPSAFGAPPGAQCSFCGVTEKNGDILIAQKGGAYLCLAHHNANRPRRAIPPEPEESWAPEEPAAPPASDHLVREREPRKPEQSEAEQRKAKPKRSVSFVAENEATVDENKATVDAERIRRNMELFASGPQYTFARPGVMTSAHKRREQEFLARAPKGRIRELDPRISAYFNSTTKFV